VPYPFFIGLGTPTVAIEEELDEHPPVGLDEKEVAQRRSRKKDDRLAELSAEERRRERSLINDTFRIHFGGRPTYIQLLSAPAESRAVLFHEQLRVGHDTEGLVVRRSFISPQDPNLFGEDASDILSERVLADGGYRPSNKNFAWAIELDKTRGGFEVAYHHDGEVERPSVGLIVQAYSNFFAPIERLQDPTGVILKTRRHKTVNRRGKEETSYSHEIAGEALLLSFELPDLDDFLTEMFEAQNDIAFLNSLPDEWKLVKQLPWYEDTPISKRVQATASL
jgi:hypothetical protein